MFLFCEKGKISKIAIDKTRATTPPSLLGIDRKIAYANKKYHSGWIWTGVTRGFAGIKFSTSPNRYGLVVLSHTSPQIINTNPKMSLKEKKGWNEILSEFELIPIGLFDPVWCKKSRWTIVRAAIINGKRKWTEKKRVSVALSTANPPHTHWTNIVPKYGIADSKLVITVAPQKDICPQGRTYPTKAVPITINKISTPTVHVSK